MERFTSSFSRSFGIATLAISLSACGALSPFGFKYKGGSDKSPSLGQSTEPQEIACKREDRDLFLRTVNPILETKCATCHAKEAFQLKVGAGLENYGFAQSRGTLVLVKATGGASHPGGSVLDADSALTVGTWLDAEDACKKAIAAANGGATTLIAGCTADIHRASAGAAGTATSNLSRSSGAVMQMRLTRLFPGAPGGKLDPNNFSLYASSGLNRMLGRPERFTTVVSQIALQALVEPVCIDAVKNVRSDAGAMFADGFLLSGETWPADANLALAMKVARNTWLYPYLATDPEVKELAALYTAALGDATTVGKLSGASADVAARSSVCLAAISAPQFWIGNPGELDVLRRVSLELARQIPTPQNYSDFKASTNRGAWLKTFAASLQSGSTYRDSIGYWHEDWLGLRPYQLANDLGSWIDPRAYADAQNGSSQLGGFRADLAKIAAPGTDLDGQDEIRTLDQNTNLKTNSELCEKKVQAFDPRTTEIRWEHHNPVSNQWELVGGWTRNGDGTYAQVPGQITLANGSTKATSLSDIRFAWSTNGKYTYVEGALVGTPLESFAAADRRVRRFSPSGEQNGYSAVKLFHTNQVVYTCNTLARFLNTCAYRTLKSENYYPTGAVNVDNRSWKSDSTGPMAWTAAGTTWVNAAGGTNQYTRQYPIFDRGGARMFIDSLAFPAVLDQFRCGAVNLNEAGKAELSSGFSEDAAYPKGYTDFSSTGAPTGLHEIAYTANFFNPTSDQSGAEYQSFLKVKEDLRLETSRLLSSALSSGNYRELLTANYTFGTDYLRLLYQTQGLFMPSQPPGFSMSGSPNAVKKIAADDLDPIVDGWFSAPNVVGRGRSSELPDGFRNYGRASKDHTIPPKSMAGILTTPSFLAPTGGTMRTVASRVFTRLLCTSPSAIKLDDSQLALHKNYVKQASHVKDGCIACHAHLDPLASAMSAAFAKDPMLQRGPFTASETMQYPIADGGTYGFRGSNNPSEGAFLGKKVTGVREVAQAIADSPQFARCTVQKAFENIFGRTLPTVNDCALTPTNADCLLVQTVANSFRDPSGLNYNYDRMIQELVSSSLNLRKN